MKKRKINVRKHKRRLKSGNATIVRKHKRQLRSSIRSKTKDDWWKRRIAEEQQEQEKQIVSLPPKEKWIVDDWSPGWSPTPIHGPTSQPKIEQISSYHVPTYITKTTYKEKIQDDISNKTHILMGQLSIPDNLKYEIQEKAETLYKNIPKKSEYRNPLIVSAASIYLVSLEKEIFIPWSKIVKLIYPETVRGRKAGNLWKALRFGLNLDPALYRKIKTPEWRKQRIRQITFGLHSDLELPFGYYQYMSEKLDKNFDRLSNERDAQIAAILWRSAMEELNSLPPVGGFLSAIKKKEGEIKNKERHEKNLNKYKLYNEGLAFLGEEYINTGNFYRTNKGFKLHKTIILKEPREDLWFLF